LRKSPFTAEEVTRLRSISDRLGFDVLYAPEKATERTSSGGSDEKTDNGGSSSEPQTTRPAQDVEIDGASTADYARLIRTPDPEAFYASYRSDIRPTSDDRPFFFHTTKLEQQFDVAFGRSMLFGNGLSALMTLLAISTVLVALFVVGPLALVDRGHDRPRN